MSKIFLVEDETDLADLLKSRLEKDGHQVEICGQFNNALRKINSEAYDLIIIDLNLPDGSGFDLVKQIKFKTKIIFITALNDANNRLQAYEQGVEEFIPKPFHLKEFLLRVNHVLNDHKLQDQISIGDLTISFSEQVVLWNSGEKKSLNKREITLLKLLILKSPSVVSRDEILDLWVGDDQYPSQRTVDNTIVSLRQILKDSDGEIIKSVRGVGYQWSQSE